MISPYDLEIEKRCAIIDLIDPLKINQTYAIMSYEELTKELEKKTTSVNEITHETYQKIYDLPVSGIGRGNELAIMKYKLTKREHEIDHLEQLLRDKEEELLIRELELNKKEKRSKTPERKGINSSSPSSYQSYIFNRSHNLYNGDMNEETALNEAIKQSEKISSDIIDLPFKTPIDEIKSLPTKREYKDKPSDVSEDILNEIYTLLLNRNFDDVKVLLSGNTISPNSVKWLRNLSYNGETLKQMLISKPDYIHKCIIVEEK